MRSAFIVVAEAAAVLAVAALLSVVINSARPNGIEWRRDYFPKTADQPAPSGPPQTPLERMTGGKTNIHADINANAHVDAGVETSAQEPSSEFAFIDFEQMRREFLENQGLTLFIDARNRKAFEEGHVPGAWLFDHYHFENYVDEVLPMCLASEKVIVYCTGGECEDSLFACRDLAQLGVPKDKLRVFEGGIQEWKEQGMDIELGPRDSGMIESP